MDFSDFRELKHATFFFDRLVSRLPTATIWGKVY
jgi:hypothetical protein